MQQAIELVEHGEFEQGRVLLAWIVEREPNNTSAWIWMACCFEDERHKQACYLRAAQSRQAA
jgi:Tfp pilus assembly protein PilF